MTRDKLAELVASKFENIPDFPKPGILFQDFTPLLADRDALRAVVGDVVDRFGGQVDAVAGIEARGFMIGAAAAVGLGVGFVPIRKAGKLPRATFAREYELEYGTATLEMHCDAVNPGARVLVMDDLLATGGTARAACELVEAAGARVVAVDTLVELAELNGRSQLDGYEVRSLLQL